MGGGREDWEVWKGRPKQKVQGDCPTVCKYHYLEDLVVDGDMSAFVQVDGS